MVINKNDVRCNRTDCLANKEGVCVALNRRAVIYPKTYEEGYKHFIDDEWTETCPFFLNKEMEKKDLAQLKRRLGIDGRRRK